MHADYLNTPRRLTDARQAVKWQRPYSGFGEIAPQSTPAAGQAPLNYSLRYPGQIDDGNGLFYNWHRFYDPRVGRYTSSDPIGLDGGWNRFGYVGGNPLGAVDPQGLSQMCHRNLLIPIPYARHCYMRFHDGSTSSYDPSGTNPDPDPNQKGTICTSERAPEKDDCIKEKMKLCDGNQYSFTKFNCCHCAEQAMKACGVFVPPSSWPNSPINPGPQPGEPGYSPSPVFSPSLGGTN